MKPKNLVLKPKVCRARTTVSVVLAAAAIWGASQGESWGATTQHAAAGGAAPPIEATTKDGKSVLLRANGTWSYVRQSAGVASKKVLAGRLNVTAGLVFNNADSKPLARAAIELLDIDIAPFVDQIPLTGERGSELGHWWMYSVQNEFGEGRAFGTGAGAVSAAKNGHVVRRTTTDFGGHAVLDSLPPGDYWLHCMTSVGRQRVAWNLSVKVAAGSQDVVLDNTNAVSIAGGDQ